MAGVWSVAAEGGANEVPDGVRPVGPRGQISGERDVWDLAQEGAVECEAYLKSAKLAQCWFVLRKLRSGREMGAHMLPYAASRGLE